MRYRTRWIVALALVFAVAAPAFGQLDDEEKGKGKGGVWWERWSVPVAAIGVLVSLTVLCITSRQQVVANRRLAKVTAVAAAERLREQLIDGARRFGEARTKGKVGKGSADFETNLMLFTIETYYEDLARLNLEPDGADRLVGGILRVLATGFSTTSPEPAGPHFAKLGFQRAGALADELKIMTITRR